MNEANLQEPCCKRQKLDQSGLFSESDSPNQLQDGGKEEKMDVPASQSENCKKLTLETKDSSMSMTDELECSNTKDLKVENDLTAHTMELEKISKDVLMDDAQADFDKTLETGEKSYDKVSAVDLSKPYVNEKNSLDSDKYLTEADVGITEYISNHDGFHGILKHRYSDFIVNEIDSSGNPVQLTNLDAPVEEKQPAKELSGALSEEYIEKLKALLEKDSKLTSVILEASDDKQVRTHVHQDIRESFPELESTTGEIDGKKIISVTVRKGKGSSRHYWPLGRGDYCKFILFKENKDTMDAINLIAKKLGVKPGMFQYAGTKDRRAKTSQEITVYRISAERLHQLNSVLRNMALGNFSYVKEPLKLGQLQGNRFIIVLRNVTGSSEQIDQALSSLKSYGFINYYGMQRFGTTSIPTHHIGRALLHSRWEEAVELIMKPRSGEDEDITECRKTWWETRDAQSALSKVPRRYNLERLLLQGLCRHGLKNFANALLTIPRNTRLMYVHSHQSYVWNTMVSWRIRKFGLKPVPGDLVINNSSESIDLSQESNKIRPLILDEKNVSNFSLHDIVMPLPGYDVMYPKNEAFEKYQEMLTQDGLEIRNLRHKNKDYSLPGVYRKIITRSSDVSWQVYHYSDVNAPLAFSDFDILSGNDKPQYVDGGKFKSIKLHITLPSSSYATMAVREILRSDTSSAHQTSLTLAAQPKTTLSSL